MSNKSSHKFQPPKGTRDFLPADLAVRRHIENIWRTVSVNHGFDEIDGPMFEHLELYTVKSGPGIESELFSFMRAGGDTKYALRPEFTPTLARLAAQHGANLPSPTKWFSICNYFRAERPQRGRLREFLQWNLDIIGDDSPRADAEIIACCAGVLKAMGFTPDDVKIKLSDREVVASMAAASGVAHDNMTEALTLLDKRDRLSSEALATESAKIGLDLAAFDEQTASVTRAAAQAKTTEVQSIDSAHANGFLQRISAVRDVLVDLGCLDWCEFDFSIVRGLAYYTGTVFEVHETSGKERAIAGGGRYDKLIELFGGKPTPAVGFAMGDVVIRLVMEDHQLLEESSVYLPRPDVFVIAGDDERARELFTPTVARLRDSGLHVRHSYKATKNIGKLLGEAGKVRARLALILGEELAENQLTLKNLESGEQSTISLHDLESALADALLGAS